MNRIIAIGEDKHWLAAVKKAGNDQLVVDTIPCDYPLLECLSCLPEADRNILLLVDACSKIDVNEIVLGLSRRGWAYIVVVAADPSAREVYKVLHESSGYDYWTKTYHVPDIRAKIEKCMAEIEESCSKTRLVKPRWEAGKE